MFPHACGQTCDVTSGESVETALQHFAAHTQGRSDVLVNNAGVLTGGKFEEIIAEKHEHMIAVNVGGLTRVAQAAFPRLRQTPGSALVNRTGYLLGTSGKIWGWLDKILPEAGRRALTRYPTNQ